MYRGDYKVGATVNFKFTTRAFATGAPTTLAGTPVVSVYKDNSTTESTAGVTLTADFDSRTGLNNVNIDTTADGTFYSSGSQFQLVITTGTVGGVSVVGEVVAAFSIEYVSALRPTVAGRTLDVSSTGEGGVDWANVGSPTTTVGLSGTTVKTATDVETDTADIQTRLPAALTAGGNMKSDPLAINGVSTSAITTIKAVQGLAVDGVVPTVTNLTNAPTNGDLTATMKTSVTTAATAATPVAASVTGAVGSVTGNVGGNVTGSVGSVVGAVGSVTGLTASNLDATISSRATPAQVNTECDTALSDVGLTSTVTGRIDAAITTRATPAQILTTALTEAYAADGAAGTLAQILFGIQSFLQERVVAGTTLTVKKVDGSTTAMTFTLDDATNPTSITRAS